MNLVARQNFGYKATSILYNTYIGGVSATISTASALATKLGISVGNISNFTIVGSDINCRITGSYAMPANAFENSTVITYFYDNDGLVTTLNTLCFYNTPNLKIVKFKNATTTGYRSFTTTGLVEIYLDNLLSAANESIGNNPSLKIVYIPRCASLDVASTATVFGTQYPVSAIIYVSPTLATINSGSPDVDLTSAISRGCSVRYVSNFTSPSPITTLALDTAYNTTIKTNFTVPSSTNAIDYYETYVDGVFNNKSYGIVYAKSLTSSTSYNVTVYVVDYFMNKSLVSNSIIISTVASVSFVNTADTDANLYITNSGITTDSSKESSARLFIDFKANSLYTKIQAFYPLKGTTSTMQKLNAKNPLDTNAAFRLTFTGAATFSDNGYQLNGSSYANTYFIPSAQQSLNNNGMTVVCGTNNSAFSADVVDVGSFNSGGQASILIVKNNNSNYGRIVRLNANQVRQDGINEARGIFTGVRQNSTTSDLFVNGVQVSSGNSGGTLPTVNSYIGCMNLGGSAYGHSNQRLQMVLFHEGLSDLESSILYSIIDLSESIAGRKTW